MSSVALFVPCYIDQFYPSAAIAALRVLERLQVRVAVPSSAVCCGQPTANAGFAQDSIGATRAFVDTYASYDQIVVLSGSCALHVRAHGAALGTRGADVASRVTEFCTYLHDVVGVPAVAAIAGRLSARVGVHIGCHALRGLGLASSSERMIAPFNKVQALLETVRGISFATPTRADECCGFGGTFSVKEPDISALMGRDRLRDYARAGAEQIVSTDMSCLMHLGGLARQDGRSMPMRHVAEVLCGDEDNFQ